MDPVTIAKLWMVIKPIRRLKQQRAIKRAAKLSRETGHEIVPDIITDQDVEDDMSTITDRLSGAAEVPRPKDTTLPVEKAKSLLTELVLSALRHNMTALGPLAVIVTDDMLVTAAGVIVSLIGFGWSVARKWMRARRENPESAVQPAS